MDSYQALVDYSPGDATGMRMGLTSTLSNAGAALDVFQAVAGQFNTTSSIFRVGSTVTGPGNVGAEFPDLYDKVYINTPLILQNAFSGTEWGIWLGDKTSSLAAIIANQTTYWGPF